MLRRRRGFTVPLAGRNRNVVADMHVSVSVGVSYFAVIYNRLTRSIPLRFAPRRYKRTEERDNEQRNQYDKTDYRKFRAEKPFCNGSARRKDFYPVAKHFTVEVVEFLVRARVCFFGFGHFFFFHSLPPYFPSFTRGSTTAYIISVSNIPITVNTAMNISYPIIKNISPSFVIL